MQELHQGASDGLRQVKAWIRSIYNDRQEIGCILSVNYLCRDILYSLSRDVPAKEGAIFGISLKTQVTILFCVR